MFAARHPAWLGGQPATSNQQPFMTPAQKRILLVLSLLVALTRLLAIAHSLNDWDEALFSLGVAEYEVDQHWPHPPGYPLFVAAAKGVHLLGVSEFRSLQTIRRSSY
jgi:hypothetical protein